MDPICPGMTGAAVEDVQDRLASLGYELSADERAHMSFGPSTANAVAKFRLEHDLELAEEVDSQCWSVLVDECYQLGSRTLYLRLPNFHGADVRVLQEALTVLGFSCGGVDGVFGPRTESAVKQFQENVGIFADGMAFQDTFDAIARLHHVWAGKPAAGPHPSGAMGFARAAEVLEERELSIAADDPVSRAIAARIWNLASATTERSGIKLIGDPSEAPESDDAFFLLTLSEPDPHSGVANVEVIDDDTLATRIRTAVNSASEKPAHVRLELPGTRQAYDGKFTASDAQAVAVILLDAICNAMA